MKIEEIGYILTSIFSIDELLFDIESRNEWIYYNNNISDKLVIMFNKMKNIDGDCDILILDSFEWSNDKNIPLSTVYMPYINTHWKCHWKEVNNKEDLVKSLKELKVKLKLFDIENDFKD